MLARVVERARRSLLVDEVVVATSDRPADAAVAAECARLHAPCFRGSEHDVLDRFHHAAVESRAETIVRITADCPLVDPGLIDLVLTHFTLQGVDHAGILTSGRSAYPRGLDSEAVRRDALECAWNDAHAPHERAHVTPYLYGRPGLFRTLTLRPPANFSMHRWTVDTPDDLSLVRAIYTQLGDDGHFSWRDVLRLMTARPDIAGLNRHVRHKRLVEG